MTRRNDKAKAAAVEFSRLVSADDIGVNETVVAIEANAGERAALAKRFELVAVESLSAQARLRRCPARDGSGMVINVTFDTNADIVQRCVVSLEPVAAKIHETDLVVEYRLDGEPELAAEVDVVPEAFDPPEILVDGRIDLGELVAEHLALALDPYPRADAAGADIAELAVGGDTAPEDEHPFAALRDWSPDRKPD